MIQKKKKIKKKMSVWMMILSDKYQTVMKECFLIQRRIHPFFFDFGFGHKCARIASSKTVFKPFWVNAEHSRYLTAPISLRIDSP